MFYFEFFVMCLIAYLIGSIPFGLILTKIFTKQDIRTIGSGNIGATNVLRTGKKSLAIATLILDMGKGICGVGISLSFAPNDIAPHSIEITPLDFFLIFCVVLGHCYPVWLKFKGGKGVATAIGGLIFPPYVNLTVCVSWILIATLTRRSSVASLVTLLLASISTLLLYGPTCAIMCMFTTLLIWFRHKDNIKRLINGNEPKIGENKKKEGST